VVVAAIVLEINIRKSLKTALALAEMKNVDFGRRINKRPSEVNRIMNKKTVSMASLSCWSEILGCTVDQLIEWGA
jgi:hypothetical protein